LMDVQNAERPRQNISHARSAPYILSSLYLSYQVGKIKFEARLILEIEFDIGNAI